MVPLAMIELTKALGAEWTAVVGALMNGGKRMRHTTATLAAALGCKETALLPFLRWADGERVVRRMETAGFAGFVIDGEWPMKVLQLRPGPMTVYRGWPVPVATTEWPGRGMEASSVVSAPYAYNEADEWSSVFVVREGLRHSRPGMDRATGNAWAQLVDDVLAHFAVEPSSREDLRYVLGAGPVRLAGWRTETFGPAPLRWKMAKCFASEEEYLTVVPEGRRDWLAGRMGIGPGSLPEAELEAMLRAWAGPVTELEAVCLGASDRDWALEALRERVALLRYGPAAYEGDLGTVARGMWEKMDREEQAAVESSY